MTDRAAYAHANKEKRLQKPIGGHDGYSNGKGNQVA
jgi:hypothetical protein